MLLPICSVAVLILVALAAPEEQPTTLGKVTLEEPHVSQKMMSPREQPVKTGGWTASAVNLPIVLQSLVVESPFLPILFARSASILLADKQCGKDALRFLKELENGTLWAARMYDASTKLPDGVLFGSTGHYGNFDECYYGGIEGLHTRYCLIDAGYERRNLRTDYLEPHHQLDPTGSLWQFLNVKPGLPISDKTMLRMALCAPASCTPSNIELSLRRSLEHTLTNSLTQAEVPFSVSVKPNNCHAFSDQSSFPLANRVYCAVIIGILILIIYASLRHEEILHKGKVRSSPEKFLLCLSAQSSLSKLVQKERSDNILNILDGTRVILTAYVVLIHRFVIQFLEVSTINAEVANLESQNLLYNAILNSARTVDVFLCMSIIIATKSWLESFRKGKSLRLWDVAFKRYLRLTPSYVFIICFYIFVLPYTNSGPHWAMKVESEADVCRENWWLNLLYINNYTARKLCMFQSWYLSTDFQTHCLVYLIVRLFWKLPRWSGYSLIIFLIIAACSLCTYITYTSQLTPTLLVMTNQDTHNGKRYEDIRDSAYFFNYYVKTHTHIAVALVGVLIGAVICDLQRLGRPLPKFFLGTCFRLTLVILQILNHVWIARYIWKIALPTEYAIYAGFNQSFYVFIAALFWISLVFGDRADKMRRLLSAHPFHVISKLTYGVFLSHHISHMYEVGSLRNSKAYSVYNTMSEVILDLVIALVISTILWFLLESPARELYNLFSNKRSTAVTKAD